MTMSPTTRSCVDTRVAVEPRSTEICTSSFLAFRSPVCVRARTRARVHYTIYKHKSARLSRAHRLCVYTQDSRLILQTILRVCVCARARERVCAWTSECAWTGGCLICVSVRERVGVCICVLFVYVNVCAIWYTHETKPDTHCETNPCGTTSPFGI